MKLPNRASKRTPLFYLEIPSEQPERMAEFYAQTLSVKFHKATYPFPHFRTTLGSVELVIRKPLCLNNDVEPGAGKLTFGVMAPETPPGDGERWFLPPQRPLGASFPERYASRLRDPDGNYLALVASMEEMIGAIPDCLTLRECVTHVRDYMRFAFGGLLKAARLRIDNAIDNWEYAAGTVSFARTQWGQFTHLVASREGIYLANPSGAKRVMRGAFYGATIKDGAIYCFQSCGWDEEHKGRILKISLTGGGTIGRVDVIAKGLDDGCHQIDFIGSDLFVVDCYNGRILQIKSGEAGYIAHAPLGNLNRRYARRRIHMNSLAGHPDGTIWLLLHNHDHKPSEILVVDRSFRPLRRFSVRAGGAHNIVFTNDELEYLIADSSGGRIISARGVAVEIKMMRPRGLSLDDDVCVAGDSHYSTRVFRRYIPGRIHFFDRKTWSCISSLALPAAPTEIRKLDGADFSISNYLMERAGRSAAARPDADEAQLREFMAFESGPQDS